MLRGKLIGVSGEEQFVFESLLLRTMAPADALPLITFYIFVDYSSSLLVKVSISMFFVFCFIFLLPQK